MANTARPFVRSNWLLWPTPKGQASQWTQPTDALVSPKHLARLGGHAPVNHVERFRDGALHENKLPRIVDTRAQMFALYT